MLKRCLFFIVFSAVFLVGCMGQPNKDEPEATEVSASMLLDLYRADIDWCQTRFYHSDNGLFVKCADQADKLYKEGVRVNASRDGTIRPTSEENYAYLRKRVYRCQDWYDKGREENLETCNAQIWEVYRRIEQVNSNRRT